MVEIRTLEIGFFYYWEYNRSYSHVLAILLYLNKEGSKLIKNIKYENLQVNCSILLENIEK